MNSVPDLVGWLRRKQERIDSGVTEAMQDWADGGMSLMKIHIATRGTGWVGRGARAYPGGRVDTGQMIDDVNATMVKDDGTTKSVSFGWTDNSDGYYLAQEYGFTHYLSGKRIEGMNAMADAKDEQDAKFRSTVRDIIRDA